MGKMTENYLLTIISYPRVKLNVAAQNVEKDYEGVVAVAQRIHECYFEELTPDTLMQAAARGFFAAMDPASEFDISTENMPKAVHRERTASRFTTYAGS